MLSDDGLRQLLARSRRIAVVGLSADWNRPSHFAAKYMQQAGYTILPVNPRYAGQTILGMPCVAQLQDLQGLPQLDGPVDIVDVFRRTEDVMPLAHAAVDIGAKCLWQQLGVKNEDAARFAEQAGLASVMDRCVKIEHARLFGGLHWAGVDTGVISSRRALRPGP